MSQNIRNPGPNLTRATVLMAHTAPGIQRDVHNDGSQLGDVLCHMLSLSHRRLHVIGDGDVAARDEHICYVLCGVS